MDSWNFSKLILFCIVLLHCFNTILAEVSDDNVQGIHVLDPEIEEFKYYHSWNSDKWVHWLRNRYIEDMENRRFDHDEVEGDNSTGSATEAPLSPLYGKYVNIIIIASADELNSAFSEASQKSYKDPERSDMLWSDVPFPVFVVVRKPKPTLEEEEAVSTSTFYNVFNCSDKKMYINAQVNVTNYHPIAIKHFFPKKVQNPKDGLRIPLVKCSKVGQTRGLLDEIKFQLGS